MNPTQRLRTLAVVSLLGLAPMLPGTSLAQDPAAATAAAQYGIASRMPQDVEIFSSAVRLGEIAQSIADSQFVTTLLNLKALQKEPEFRQMLADWRNDPDIQQAKQLGGAIFGQEFAIVGAKGTAASVRGVLSSLNQIQAGALMAFRVQAVPGGQPPDQAEMQKQMMAAFGGPDNLIRMTEEINVPPLLLIARAGAAKPVIDGFIAEALAELPPELPPFVEKKEVQVAGKYTFQTLSISAARALDMDRAKAEEEMTKAFGSAETAKRYLDAASKKSAAITWGWADDYFIVAIGPDHSHVKFAASPAESLLANPAVAKRLAVSGTNKVLGLSWMAKPVFDAMEIPLNLAAMVRAIPEEAMKQEGIDIDMNAVAEEVAKIDASTTKFMDRDYDDLVSVSWLEKGLRQESWGGPKHTGPAPAPLALASLRGPATVLSIMGRTDWTKARAFIETTTASLDKIFSEEIRPNLPQDAQPAVAMGDAIGRPILTGIWKTISTLGKALGDESGLILNLDGKMPALPQIPPQIAETVPVPRMAWVHDLKDRAALSEAWKALEPIINQALSFVPKDAIPGGKPKIVSAKDGGIETWSFQLPVDLGDIKPHLAATANRWIWSTSPDLTRSIAAAAPATGEPLVWHMNLNAKAATGFVDKLLPLIRENKDSIPDYAEIEPDITAVRSLLDAFGGIDAKGTVEEGQTRMSLHIQVSDID